MMPEGRKVWMDPAYKVRQMRSDELAKKVHANQIDLVSHMDDVLEECSDINDEYFYFNTISADLAKDTAKHLSHVGSKESKGPLAGVAVSVKDCICVKGDESTAGSRILQGYKPVFDATVISRVKEAGAVIIGKTAQDEFGFGSFSVNVGLDKKIPLNPFDKERACGGSSGGAAGLAQKVLFPHIALGQSTGGSIVAPASFCGVVGLCPTYGRVSRYGLMDYANSLDKIGPLSKTVYESAMMLEIIAGHDKRESTTLDAPVEKYTSSVGKEIKGMRIGVLNESLGEGTDPEVSERVKDAVAALQSAGVKVENVSLPLTHKYVIPCYYLIAMSEASTNLAKYCGMRYGKHERLEGSFNEYFSKVRELNFGKEAKRRIVLGTFARMAGYRDAYYIKALKVRTKIIDEYKRAFKDVDAIVSPTMPFVAPKIKEIAALSPLQNYMADVLTAGPNLAGLPHISVPVGLSKKSNKGMPIGLMLTGDHLQESKMIALASHIEKEYR